jgi:hypothetical protein
MLVDRIIGAFTFRKGVYAEVENDTTFTTTAWILVVAVAFLNQLGSTASSGLIDWLLGAIVGTVLSILGFVAAIAVINWVARTVFDADVTFDELVRTLGLAHVWNVVGILGVLAAISGALDCLLAPVRVIAVLLLIAAWLIAAKEALDLEWGPTIVSVFLGWLALVVVSIFVTGLVLGLLGLGAVAMGGIGS